MSKIKLSENFIKNTVKLALNEDLYPSGDITSDLIKNNKIIEVKLISNENAIIGGLRFAKHAFALIDNKIKFITKKKDGSFVKKNSLIASIKGKAKNILIAERVALNFLSSSAFINSHIEKPYGLITIQPLTSDDSANPASETISLYHFE